MMSSVRIITVDHYMSPPSSSYDPVYSHFRSSVIKEVPVIRIFGVTQSGEKACVHIHGIFPYICIPIPIREGLSAFNYKLAEDLDKAINSSIGCNIKQQHVYNISEISGFPFYGYYSEKQTFLKIEFYSPFATKRAVQVLQSGAVCGQKFQPHEAHLSYTLQFFVDYNLHGMNFVYFSKVNFRATLNDEESGGTLSKKTCCQVELDAFANDILNHSLESNGDSLNPGLSSIREEEKRRRLDDGLEESSLSLSENRNFEPTKSDRQFRNQFLKAIEARKRREKNTLGDRDSQCSLQEVRFDNEDVSVLKVLLDRIVSTEEVPDEDSILGSWSPDQNEDGLLLNEEQTEVEDLSQPYVSFIEICDSEEEAVPFNEEEGVIIKSEPDETIGRDLLYLDGNIDDIEEEPKGFKRQREKKNLRYRPLDVRLYKSPRKKGAKKKKISSPEMFDTFEKNTSELRKIKSPKTDGTLHDQSMNIDKTSPPIGQLINEESTSNRRSQNNLVSVKRTLFEGSDKKSLSEASNPKPQENVNELRCFTSVSSYVPSYGFSDEKNGEQVLSSEESSNRNALLMELALPKPSNDVTVLSSKVSYSNCDSDDSCGVLHWNDTVATQNSIASFYGDTTIFVPTECDLKILTPAFEPPSTFEIEETLTKYNLECVKPIEPFYSNPCDGPSSKEIGFRVLTLKSKFAPDLEEFKGDYGGELDKSSCRQHRRSIILQPAKDPPSPDKIAVIVEDHSTLESSIIALTPDELSFTEDSLYHQIIPKMRKKRLTQVERNKRQSGEIDIATPNNSGQFRMEFQNLQEANISCLYRYTTLMVLEVYADSRGELCPDPEHDAIQGVFYLIINDIPPQSELPCRQIGAILISPANILNDIPSECSLKTVNNEEELFLSLLDLVKANDPDIVAGYEIEMQSWGFLIQRGYHLGFNLLLELSRVKTKHAGTSSAKQQLQHDYDLRIPGRIVLNVWRLMRHEVALLSYSFGSVVYHILHTRVPKFSYKTLTFWWNHMSRKFRYLVVKYYLMMVDGTERLLDQLDFIRRTSELASLFGIQFYEVLSRGSQFRVESMMLRLAKRLNFVAVSPNVEQRAHMMAPQSLPLIMEPESKFYGDPVIVLDFQSLYPSMMIAYNYCFSTCLGRLADLVEQDEIKFGCTTLKTSLNELIKLKKNIHVSPAGVVFVDKFIRKGILPQMLEEILETRIMVKKSMKRHKDKKLLYRALDARQLGLKLIANVTYGYTSANFSGRMPCIEVGDSVVSKGRETLERAIRMVEQTPEWKARVVYGDTDSMFVLCPGRGREEAFLIGQQIAERVTESNPPPVKLKLEKVYQPCILQTKKRYVGFMYESVDQTSPVFDAKGIETVRRDGCPAASKILEKSLKLLFENGDVSCVRQYVEEQLVKVLSGRLSASELSFAKEYRGLTGYHPSAPVPALKIAKELMAHDRRAEPRRSERVPYVVVCGPPGLPLISLVRHLPSFLSDCSQLVLNADYYITKAILPPLDRCLSLLGADVFSWYSSLPKKQLFHGQQLKASGGNVKKATIAQYFATINCVACSRETQFGLCQLCQTNPQVTLVQLSTKLQSLERKAYLCNKICQSCCSRSYETDCISLDCPILFRRIQVTNDQMQINPLRQVVEKYINEIK